MSDTTPARATDDVRARLVAELDRYVQVPADKRDWPDGMRDAWEHHAVNDFTEAYAAARRVYLDEAARAVLAAVGPTIAAQALRDAAAETDYQFLPLRTWLYRRADRVEKGDDRG